MLHRAENVTLLYNNFSEGLSGGEKSRFISQIEFERNPRHKITKKIISHDVKAEGENPSLAISLIINLHILRVLKYFKRFFQIS